MIAETILAYAGAAWVINRLWDACFGGDDEEEEEAEAMAPRAAEKLEAVRQVKLYLEPHPLKCIDCNLDFQGPLTPPSGGCPKCGSACFVVPTDDQDITKMVQARPKAVSARADGQPRKVNAALRNSLVAQVTDPGVICMASKGDTKDALETLYAMWKSSEDPVIEKALVRASTDPGVICMMGDGAKRRLKEILKEMATA